MLTLPPLQIDLDVYQCYSRCCKHPSRRRLIALTRIQLIRFSLLKLQSLEEPHLAGVRKHCSIFVSGWCEGASSVTALRRLEGDEGDQMGVLRGRGVNVSWCPGAGSPSSGDKAMVIEGAWLGGDA